mmetsp:Transcript_31138/g.56868  ORF Transcript_31138/g.56868 Transcript_31138/m.56868 type:complete len:554 (+) Transcript_31138:119-1780(+)
MLNKALVPHSREEDSMLAAEVLQVSGILAQEAGPYRFPVDDIDGAQSTGGSATFELSRDDMLYLIGLLNSKDIAIAKTELGVLLSKLDRPVVQGLTTRLFAALRRRNNEMIAARDELRHEKGAGAAMQAQGARPRRQTIGKPDRPAPRSPPPPQLQAPAVPPTSSSSPRLVKNDHVMSTSSLYSDVRRPRRHNGATSPTSDAKKSPSGKGDELPPVFRRLTAPVCRVSDEARTREALASAGSPDINRTQCALTIGGVLAERPDNNTAVLASSGMVRSPSGPKVSEYLEQLLEAHELDAGLPVGVRRPLGIEDIDPTTRQVQRVPEEKAREIFDRLYRSGKEHRVRRRVYHELGLLVEQAKEAQTCTFEPDVPLAKYPGGVQPEGPVAERLYRDGMERLQRREELMQTAPVSSFRPATLTESGYFAAGRRLEIAGAGPGMGLSPRDTLGPRDVEPPHIRLYREHMERRTRQSQREVEQAEWRKYTYKPDISSSQVSGPQIIRSVSVSGLPLARDDDYDDIVEVQTQEDVYNYNPLPVDEAVESEIPRQSSSKVL